jgi:SAM-dependent methyltransferase
MPLPELTRQHLDKTRAFYDEAPTTSRWAARGYRELLAHYFNLIIPADASVLEVGCGAGELLGQLRARRRVGADLSPRQIEAARARLPGADFHVMAGEELDLAGPFDVIIISDTLNLAADVQALLGRLQRCVHPDTRLVINFQNSLWRPFFSVAEFLGLRDLQPQSSWLAASDVLNLLHLGGWNQLTLQGRILLPVPIPGLNLVLNRWLAPLLQWFCLTYFIVARPSHSAGWATGPGPSAEGNRTAAAAAPAAPATVSVIIPARNEAGNIEAAVRRTPEMGAGTELIFVEGHSRDNTWGEIQRVAAAHPERRIRIMQQTGKGKGDAVRAGFAAATGDILMILDADLTMPPEELPKFHAVIASGQAEFANGVRLVYPMDEKAMQFLNLCANKAFGLIFTWLLGQPVKDTLCGTKVLRRAHYERIAANRAYFGDFDPFGDFDLLFGAARLNLKIADVPIRYKERTYGETNIQRWKHGWLLLRMVVFAARKLKFV